MQHTKKQKTQVWCPVCGKRFTARSSQLKHAAETGHPPCCSHKCANEYLPKPAAHLCLWCGKPLVNKRKRQHYCDRSCAALHRHHPDKGVLQYSPRKTRCPQCQRSFVAGTGSHTNGAYCSLRCHALAHGGLDARSCFLAETAVSENARHVREDTLLM